MLIGVLSIGLTCLIYIPYAVRVRRALADVVELGAIEVPVDLPRNGGQPG
jgi:hypothetical protein